MWSLFCPLGLWIAGRPSKLALRTVLGVFFAPWLVAAPIAAFAVLAWWLLRTGTSPWIADAVSLVAIGPLAAVAAIVGSVWMRKDTRADIMSIIERFRRRRHRPTPVG